MTDNDAIQMLERCKYEIESLRRIINILQPKAEAYDALTTVLGLLPKPAVGMGEDIIWKINKELQNLIQNSVKQHSEC